MKTFKFITFLLLPFSILIFYIWRYASRHREIPCPFWLSWLVERDNPLTTSQKAHTIMQQSEIHPGLHIIDCGCGPGRLTIPLAENVGSRGKVTAVDCQPQMLQKAEKKAAERKLKNIEFVQGTIGAGDLTLPPCDRAMLITALGEMLYREAAFQEIFNALKPGGTLTVTETRFDPHFQRREAVLRLAIKAGFHEKSDSGNWAAFSLVLERPADKWH